MIYKNCKYGKIHDMVVAEFGFGDIHMANGITKSNVGQMLLRNGDPMPLGDIDGETSPYKGMKGIDDFPPDMVIIFNNTASISVVIDQLIELKDYMEGKKTIESPNEKQ